MEIEILYIVFYFKQFKSKISEFRFGKTSCRKIRFLISVYSEKTVEKTSAFLDGSYITEPSSVRIGDREEST